MSSSSSSSLSQARAALEGLRALLGGGSDEKPQTQVKKGVVFSLSSVSGKVYIGFEYDNKVEKLLKDLLVRHVSYLEMGYLHESSTGVLDEGPVSYKVLKRVDVKSKYELGRIAESYMLELDEGLDVVNLWKPEELLRGEMVGLYDDDSRIEDVERYKKDKWEELMRVHGSKDKVIEYRKSRMSDLRELKDELYDMLIKNKPRMAKD